MTAITYRNIKKPIIPVGDLPMLALFARGEQGAWYDPSDLYNYRGYGDSIPDFLTWQLNGTATPVEDGVHVTGLSTPNGISFSGFASTGKWYEYMIRVDTTAGAAVLRGPLGTVSMTRQGPNQVYRGVVQAVNNGAFQITSHASMESDFIIREVLIREVTIGSPTMFQDAEGTIPVTGVEQPVGLILDKSGNGNHASQLTAPARPMLSALVNLMAESNSMPAGTGLLYTRQGATFTDGQPGPYGTSDAVLVAPPYIEDTGGSSTSRIYGRSARSLVEGEKIVISVHAKWVSGEDVLVCLTGDVSGGNAYFNPRTGQVVSAHASVQAGVIAVGDGFYRFWMAYTATAADVSPNQFVYLTNRTTNASFDPPSNGTEQVVLWGLQVENGSLPTRYQRVTSATDYDWQGWPLYLRFDGVDDEIFCPGFTLTSSWTLACVSSVEPSSSTSTCQIFGLSRSATNYFRIAVRRDNNSYRSGFRSAAGGHNTGTIAISPINTHMMGTPHAAWVTVSPDSVRQQIDGAPEVVVSPGAEAAPNSPYSLGVLDGALTVPVAQRFYGGAAFNRSTTPEDAALMMKTLREKAGMA